MGTVVAFKRSEDGLKIGFKDEYETITKKFIFDAK